MPVRAGRRAGLGPVRLLLSFSVLELVASRREPQRRIAARSSPRIGRLRPRRRRGRWRRRRRLTRRSRSCGRVGGLRGTPRSPQRHKLGEEVQAHVEHTSRNDCLDHERRRGQQPDANLRICKHTRKAVPRHASGRRVRVRCRGVRRHAPPAAGSRARSGRRGRIAARRRTPARRPRSASHGSAQPRGTRRPPWRRDPQQQRRQDECASRSHQGASRSSPPALIIVRTPWRSPADGVVSSGVSPGPRQI